jgi:hypothetical protein
MINFYKTYYSFLFLLFVFNVKAQEEKRIDMGMISANVGVGYFWTAGDLSDRFGTNTGMTVALEKTFSKGSAIALEYQLNFSSNVKEDVFASYRNENGNVIGINGLGAFTYLRMRSNYAGISYGQALYKKNNGIKLKIGGGLFSHYIRILDDSRNLVLADEQYRKGFDRLTNGLAAKQEVIYEYHGVTNNYHFNLGFSIMEGFTNPVRSINFDTGLASPSGRMDILYGLNLVWMVPIYKSGDAVKYY